MKTYRAKQRFYAVPYYSLNSAKPIHGGEELLYVEDSVTPNHVVVTRAGRGTSYVVPIHFLEEVVEGASRGIDPTEWLQEPALGAMYRVTGKAGIHHCFPLGSLITYAGQCLFKGRGSGGETMFQILAEMDVEPVALGPLSSVEGPMPWRLQIAAKAGAALLTAAWSTTEDHVKAALHFADALIAEHLKTQEGTQA